MARGANNRPIIIVKKVKKVAGGHHGGAWKVAYADFVTAMMAFFMLLWLISSPDKSKLHSLAEYFTPSVSISTGGAGSAAGASTGGAHDRSGSAADPATKGQPTVSSATAGAARGGTAAVPDAALRVLASELRVAMDSTPDQRGKQNLQVTSDPTGLRVTLMDSDKQSMFRSGTAELNDYAKGLLAHVAAKIGKSGTQIAIEGHTDGTGGQSDANWALSGQRALAARSALIADGIGSDRFSQIIAKGATEPVYRDQPNRAENRRITIILQAQASSLPSDASFKL